jgi:predicted HTH transcriptional regulator
MHKVIISSVQKEFESERKAIAELSSFPRNPLLANCFFLTGEIERYGTGTLEMIKLSKKSSLVLPKFSEQDTFKALLYRPSYTKTTAHDTAHDTAQVTANDGVFIEVDELSHRLVWIMESESNRTELMEKLDLNHRQNFIINYINPALEEKLIEYTIPDKPTSRNQKYRLTRKGKTLQKN